MTRRETATSTPEPPEPGRPAAPTLRAYNLSDHDLAMVVTLMSYAGATLGAEMGEQAARITIDLMDQDDAHAKAEGTPGCPRMHE